MRSVPIILIIVSTIILSSCASGYKYMQPEKIVYSNKLTEDGLQFSYFYNVLSETDNDDYSKKEIKSPIKVLAVKIKNETGRKLDIGEDVLFLKNGQPVETVSPKQVESQIKQGTLGYLFYLLLTPMNLTISREDNTDTYPIGLAVGPGIAFGNMIYASSANSTFKKNLITENILTRQVGDGETVYGLLCILGSSMDPITIKLK